MPLTIDVESGGVADRAGRVGGGTLIQPSLRRRHATDVQVADDGAAVGSLTWDVPAGGGGCQRSALQRRGEGEGRH